MDYFNKGLIATAKEIRKELQNISERLADLHENLVGIQKEAERAKNDTAQQSRVVAEVIRSEEEIREQRVQQDRNYVLQKSIRRAGWWTFTAVAIYAIITYGMWVETRKATQATQIAALAAADSAKLARQQVIGSQAAILGIRFDVLYRFLPGEAHGLRSIVEYRSGIAMATNIHASIDVSWKDPKKLNDVSDPQHFEFDILQLRSENPRSVVNMLPFTGLNPDVWESIRQRSKSKTIGIKGTFQYNNGFNQTPQQPFCFIWFAHPEILGNSAGDFVECPQYKSLVVMFDGFDKKVSATKKRDTPQ